MDSDWEEEFYQAFELVIMRHVLEHSLAPVQWLQKVSRILKPDGLLYVAVPDMLHFQPPLWGSWFQIPHTYYFSQQTLFRTASLSALKPIYIEEAIEDGELWAIFNAERTY